MLIRRKKNLYSRTGKKKEEQQKWRKKRHTYRERDREGCINIKCSCICTAIYWDAYKDRWKDIHTEERNVERNIYMVIQMAHTKLSFFFPYAQKCMCSGVFFHIRQQSVSSQKAFGIRYLCSCQRTLLVLLLLMVLVLMLQCCYCRRRWWCGTVDAIRLLSLVLQSHC